MKTPEELTIFAKRLLTLLQSKAFGPYEATKHVLGAQAARLLSIDSPSAIAQYLAPRPNQVAPPLKSRRSRVDADAMDTSDDERIDGEAPAKRRCR